jgi:hypothetical protein
MLSLALGQDSFIKLRIFGFHRGAARKRRGSATASGQSLRGEVSFSVCRCLPAGCNSMHESSVIAALLWGVCWAVYNSFVRLFYPTARKWNVRRAAMERRQPVDSRDPLLHWLGRELKAEQGHALGVIGFPACGRHDGGATMNQAPVGSLESLG